MNQSNKALREYRPEEWEDINAPEPRKVSTDDCWHFAGRVRPSGYPEMQEGQKTVNAHRVIYQSWVGPIPEGYQLDHLCMVRCCINPDHLEPVTARENMRRARGNKRGYCRNGHLRTAENTLLYYNKTIDYTVRRCRVCMRIKNIAQAERRKEENARRRKLGMGGRQLRTHCFKGHELTPDNCKYSFNSVRGKMQRKCVTCYKAYYKAKYQAKRQQLLNELRGVK